jgi:hypothetical protein
MIIFLFGTATAIIGTGIGYLVNQLRPPKQRSRTTQWVIIGSLVLLGLGSGFLAYWQVTAQAPAEPIAAIQAPQNGEKIPRVLTVEVGVTRQPAGDHSLWLGYQNEAGGPLIVQAQRCVLFAKSADCGPLHVGQDVDDPSAFKIFLFDADKGATGQLETIGGKIAGGPGANMALDEWPDGTSIISMVRNITLRHS